MTTSRKFVIPHSGPHQAPREPASDLGVDGGALNVVEHRTMYKAAGGHPCSVTTPFLGSFLLSASSPSSRTRPRSRGSSSPFCASVDLFAALREIGHLDRDGQHEVRRWIDASADNARVAALCTCMTEQGTRYTTSRSPSAAPSRATVLSTTLTSNSAICKPGRSCPAPHPRNLQLAQSRPFRRVATR